MLWQRINLKKEEESKLKNKLGTINIADFYIYFANIMQIFIEGYGFKNSVEKGKPIDKNNNPIPLYTYPAIEYLQSLDFSKKRIFEIGISYNGRTVDEGKKIRFKDGLVAIYCIIKYKFIN